MKTKIDFYGRRICRFSIPGGYIFTWSGQWVGHKSYGREKGTERQIRNSRPHRFIENGGSVVSYEGSSDKIFWNRSGVAAGDIIAKVEGGDLSGDKYLIEGLHFSE